MAFRLFHLTCREAAQAILAEGFKDGEDGLVWLSEIPDCWGEQARSALLEIVFEADEADLAAYSAKLVADEVLDDNLVDFVKDPNQAEILPWYAMPAEVINRIGKIRLIDPIERKQLILDLC